MNMRIIGGLRDILDHRIRITEIFDFLQSFTLQRRTKTEQGNLIATNYLKKCAILLYKNQSKTVSSTAGWQTQNRIFDNLPIEILCRRKMYQIQLEQKAILSVSQIANQALGSHEVVFKLICLGKLKHLGRENSVKLLPLKNV